MTADAWLEIGRERAADAEAVLKERPASICSIYLAGYSVECSIKAYLQATGRKVITSGGEGHNLTGLWKSSGLRKSDIGGTEGARTFYFEEWNTALRYSTTGSFGGQTHDDLVTGARQITGWLHQQVQRKRARRRR